MRLESKVALISGGARGMGAVEARMFANEGAKVVIADMLAAEGRQVEAEIIESGGECLFVNLNVTDESGWQNAVEITVSRFGKLDILVNNAGIARINTVEDTSSDEWDLVMDINAKGVFLGTKYVLPEMKKHGSGSIINISSVSGLRGQAGIQPVYNASKGAVRLFTKSTAVQYGQYGIRANSIHPGAIDTQMIAHTHNDREDVFKDLVPLQRIAQPIEVAYGALYLASDESSYVTGSELIIDGGLTAK